MLISHPNSRAIDLKTFDCDYYRYIQDKNRNPSAFPEAYMSEYSWAEETLGYLIHLGDSERY